jgi:hypothetical protein
MDTKKNHPPPSKIDQLVDDAKTELNRVGIETEGKRSDEILKMAREERNKPRVADSQVRTSVTLRWIPTT